MFSEMLASFSLLQSMVLSIGALITLGVLCLKPWIDDYGSVDD
jgi:hypothetical protein